MSRLPPPLVRRRCPVVHAVLRAPVPQLGGGTNRHGDRGTAHSFRRCRAALVGRPASKI